AAPDVMGQGDPRGAGAAADRAVGDQPAVAVEVGGGEDAADVFGAAERPALVVEAVDGLVDRGRDVTGAAAGLHAAGGPEPLPLVLGLRAHVHDGGGGVADRARHLGVAGAQPAVMPAQRGAGGGPAGPLAAPPAGLRPP